MNRQRLVFSDTGPDPRTTPEPELDAQDPPETPTPEPAQPQPPQDQGFQWDAAVALETGRLIDKGVGYLKDPDLWAGLKAAKAFMRGGDPDLSGFSTNGNGHATPEDIPTNGAAPPSEPGRDIAVTMTPRFDMDKLMDELEKAVVVVVAVKGNDPISDVPLLMRDNRDLVKKELQKVLQMCFVYEQQEAV